MQDTRRAELLLEYNGKDISSDLTGSLISFTYNDAAPGSLDDIQITLEDRERKWQRSWSPVEGDKIKARIQTKHWGKPGEVLKLPLGAFEVDAVDIAGPPDVVTIMAVSLPIGSNIRQEKRSKAWEKVSLKTIAADAAKKSGLKLLYEVQDNPTYDRLDQSDVSDLAFLFEQAKNEGIAIKIASGKLILFDEAEYERKPPVASIVRGKGNIVSYSFGWSTAYTAYRACVVTYTNAKDKKTFKATYTPPGAPAKGPILKINEQVDSNAAAVRLARKRLREKNKEAGKAGLSLAGDIRLAAGATIRLEGWGRFDGKYLIESASHSVSSGGYTTNIDIRKVLGW